MANYKIMILALVGTSLFFSGCATSPAQDPGPGSAKAPRAPSVRGPAAFFAMQGNDPKDVFIIRLDDPAKVQHARNILNGTETRRIHVSGRIVKQKAHYNPAWSYHLDSDTINFFDLAMEVCDADMRYIEKNLHRVGDFFLPENHWCPWASKLVSEIKQQ